MNVADDDKSENDPAFDIRHGAGFSVGPAVCSPCADDDAFVQRLRAAREARGWSREEVASRLRLPARVIELIEKEDYHGIAHAVYLRGYLTSYARLVGVPVDLAENVVARRTAPPPLVATGTVSRSRYLLERYSVSATYLILTGLIVAPAVWLATHGGIEQNLARGVPLDTPATASSLVSATASTMMPADPVADAAVPERASETTVPVIESPPPVIASMASFVSPASAPAPVAAAPSTAHVLTLRLQQASWVEIIAVDGSRLEYGLLPAGSERSYHTDASVSVRLGNAEGASVEADGQPVDLAPYRRANVAHVKLFGAQAPVARADS